MKDAKQKMKEFIAAKETPGISGVVDDPDFIVKEYLMSPEDPCPCGGSKKLKDCHLPKA